MTAIAETATASSPATSGAGDARRWDLVAAWLIVGAVAALFVSVAVRALATRWMPAGDYASMELRVRDVFGPHTPLVGPFSRFGWSHPGPALFFVLAIPYRLLGGDSNALLFGAVLVNATAAGIALFVGWRRGRVAGLCTVSLVLAILVHALGATFLFDDWNPYVIVLPLFALVLVTWGVLCGDVILLPVGVALASFAAQSHVGAAVPSVVLMLVAFVAAIRTLRREHGKSAVRVVWGSAALGVFLWLPPIIEGRNLGRVVSYSLAKHPDAGLAFSLRLLSSQLGFHEAWFSGAEHVVGLGQHLDPQWSVPVALALLLGAGFAAWRRRDSESLGLVALATVFGVIAVLAVSNVDVGPDKLGGTGGPVQPYITRWTWLVGALVWLAISWTALNVLRQYRRHALVAGFQVVATIVSAALFLTTAGSATTAALPADGFSRAIAAMGSDTTKALKTLCGPILLSTQDVGGIYVAEGLLLRGVVNGLNVRLDSRDEIIVGSWHVVAPRSAATTVSVSAAPEEIARMRGDRSLTEIAQYDNLTPAERQFVDQQTALLAKMSAADRKAWESANPQIMGKLLGLEGKSFLAGAFVDAKSATTHCGRRST